MILDATKAASLLDNITGTNILVIGDLMLDRFVDGRVERISPEAPVPILSQSTVSEMPGGAANVARNICQLGASATLLGIIGDDNAADALTKALKTMAGLAFVGITVEGRPTTTKTRFRSGAQQILRLDEEVTTPISSATKDQLLKQAEQQVAMADLVILSDYAKGCLSRPLIKEIIQLAKQHETPVIIDPKSDDFSRYEGAFLVTPNLAELTLATGITDALDDTIAKAAKNLAETHHIDHILTTLSARGMRLIGGGIDLQIPSIAKDVFDVSGAGDTVVAALSVAYAADASLETAMVFANQAASIVVSKPGTAAFCAGELIAACASIHETKTDDDSCLDLVTSWRAKGLKIGFTNGCFDILHAGHMHVLREAKSQCDKLIVGLNSDSSVTALKGPQRPLQNQEIRSFVLSHLPFVDAVVIFADDTPLRVITKISPDYLIKGGDYQPKEIVGYDHVTEKGGVVKTIDLLDGHSTTAFSKGLL